jgi:hypothetical protein
LLKPEEGANGSRSMEMQSRIPFRPTTILKEFRSFGLVLDRISEPIANHVHHIKSGPERPPHTADIL